MSATKRIVPATRTENIKYAIRDILCIADEAKAAGKDMLYLNIGDPNIFGFAPPRHILDDSYQAMLANNLGYSGSDGVDEALGAVRRSAERKGIGGIQHTYICSGCSEAIDLALIALVNRGENVLTPSPGYPLYTAILSKLEAENRPYYLDEENGWRPDVADIKSKINDKTRAIVLINPNNPTGSLYPRESLQAVIDLAMEHNLVIFSDEIYDKLIFDGREHVSTAALSSEVPVITFNGLSKSYVVPGFRIGWGVVSGPAEMLEDYCEAIRKMERARLSANHPQQYAIKGALEGDQSNLHQFIEALQRRRDITVEGLNAIDGITCVKPEGAFYAFPRVDLGVPDSQLCTEIIRETGVVIVPGSGFGQRPGTQHFRVVFLPADELLAKAFERIDSIAKKYR
ncbi:MAG: aminotransferase class I/II-fold pyridoxal phosphate-dependent enzyme [bacterium]|nr:aminotransferase class I/II-fold pyridoxal phosphate-dependent enzyme [bacterium]